MRIWPNAAQPHFTMVEVMEASDLAQATTETLTELRSQEELTTSLSSQSPVSPQNQEEEEIELGKRRALAAWNRHDVDFASKLLQTHYGEMSESERVARWRGVQAIRKLEPILLTVDIPFGKFEALENGWYKLLDGANLGIPRVRKTAVTENARPTESTDMPAHPTNGAGDSIMQQAGAQTTATLGKEKASTKDLAAIAKALKSAHARMSMEEVQTAAESAAASALATPVFDETQVRRRNTVPRKAIANQEDVEEETTAPKPGRRTLTIEEKKERFPPKDLNIDEEYPHETRKTPIEVLEVALEIKSGAPRKKGEFVATVGYLRHCAAPYAYTYSGKLRRCYYGWVKKTYEEGPKQGQRIWSDALIKTLCEDFQEYHEEHPNVVNAAGSLYRRLPPYIKPCRAPNGQFRKRARGEDPKLTTFGKANVLAASLKDEDNLVRIKAFTAKDIGVRRITKDDEAKLKPIVQATVEQQRLIGLQKGMIPLIKHFAEQDANTEIAALNKRVQQAELRATALEELADSLAEQLTEALDDFDDMKDRLKVATAELLEKNRMGARQKLEIEGLRRDKMVKETVRENKRRASLGGGTGSDITKRMRFEL